MISLRADAREQTPDVMHCKTPCLLEGLRVLVVDDQPDALDLVGRMLVERGAEVRAALSADEAMAALDGFAPHVLLSDIGMPGGDGYELVRRVREAGWDFRRLPAVALTVLSGAEHRVRNLRSGFQSHLTKPVDPEDLAATVAAVAGIVAWE